MVGFFVSCGRNRSWFILLREGVLRIDPGMNGSSLFCGSGDEDITGSIDIALGLERYTYNMTTGNAA
jgi:hypothetical protein